jgi:capsular exopolysaccharide synthesis family protein
MPNPDPLDLPPSMDVSEPGRSSDLHGLIRLVLERAWLIVSCLVLAVVAVAVYVEYAPRVYEATTTVQVEQEDAKVVKVEQVVSEDMRSLEILNTVAQKLCNGALLEKVLDENNLLPAKGEVLTRGTQTLTREELITWFSKHVKSSLRRNTRLIDITVSITNPQLAARLANGLVENYLAQDALVQQTANAGAGTFLQQEAERLKKKLEASDQALQDYRKQVGAISLEQDQDIVTPQLQDLNKRLTEIKADVVQAQGAYQDSLNMGTNVEDLLAYPQIAADPEVMQIAADVAKQENELAVIRQRYREKHPKYVLAESSLTGLKKQLAVTTLKVRARIQESLRIVCQKALTARQGLEAQLHDAETNAMLLSDSAVRFNVLTREVKSDQALFDSVITRLGETAVAAQITPERIRVIQPALVPELPSSPKIKLLFALAIFGGLGLGLGISFLLYAMDSSFRTVDEVEQFLEYPVLGAIPKLAKLKGNELVTAQDANSSGAEVFRSMRATLSMLGKENDRRTYLFTSSLPGEGKTFNSANYAASLAQQGLRTLLVDLDMRRPMVEKFFLGESSHLPGVSDYFLGRKKFEELWQQNKEIPKLCWIPAGTPVPNPAELLTQSDFAQLLKEGLAHFDRVIIDTAPLLPVSDTLLLADKVQTVVLVVKSCKTSRKAVTRSLQLLKNANAPVAGLVLNLLPNRLVNGYYYSYYQGYGYGHYGHYGKKKKSKNNKDGVAEVVS